MASPQSWDCPICLRHVPAKVAECYCGYRRSEPVVAASGTPARTALAAAGAAVFVIGGVAAYMLQAPPPPPAASSAAPVLPSPPAPPASAPAAAGPTMPAAWKALAIETTPSPAGAAPAAAAQTASPSPSPTPDESVEAQRVKGLAAFESAIAGLTARIADFHEKLRRYDAQCEASNTTITGCDNARSELLSVAQAIASDAEAADDQARRSWVDPGQRRALRERGGVDENAVRDVLKAASDAARR